MPSETRLSEAPEDGLLEQSSSLLSRIRNMWQFANLCQWIYIFGKAAKIDDTLDIEEIESECLKPNSQLLSNIALALLKLVSSHRGLTHDIFDAQARRQYSISSSGHNPFGEEEKPRHFADFDIFTKIIVLQQLTQWAMMHPDRLRDHMEEQKDIEQTTWRIEPYGWDSQDRTYYVLDDNRIYRLSEPPPKPTHKRSKSRSYGSGRRSTKRRRISQAANNNATDEDAEIPGKEPDHSGYVGNEGLGGMIWECVAITLPEVQHLLGTMARTRDENEKILRKQLEVHLLPILEKQEEARKRRQLQRERELLNQAKMANAKRSSRIANKKEEQKVKAEQQQLEEEETRKRKKEKKQQDIDREREARFLSREKRLKDRETRRLDHEERLKHLAAGPNDESATATAQSGRVSERNIQAAIDRNKQALMDLEDEEDSWVFDCVCGLHGQVDDGTHSVACERCNTWQHSKCLGISEAVADRPDFCFVCSSCRRQREEEQKPHRTPIKIVLHVTAAPTTTEKHDGTGEGHPEGDNHSTPAAPVPAPNDDSLPPPQDPPAQNPPAAAEGRQSENNLIKDAPEPPAADLSMEATPLPLTAVP